MKIIRQYLFKNYQRLLLTGMICLSAGILIERFAGDTGILNFLTGVFIGMSIVFNLTGLYLFGRKRIIR
jgi:hypothetical protein